MGELRAKRRFCVAIASVLALQRCSGLAVDGAEGLVRGGGSMGALDRPGGVAAIPEARRHLRSQPEEPEGSEGSELPPPLPLEAVGALRHKASQQRKASGFLDVIPPVPEECLEYLSHAVSDCDFHGRQVVEWEFKDISSSSTFDCQLIPSGRETIECDHVAWRSGKGVTVGIVALAGVGISVCFLLALSRYGKSRTIRVAQPALCSAFVIGIGVTFFSALALLGPNREFSCALRLWLWSFGFDLAFGALVLKLWHALNAVEMSMKFQHVTLTTGMVQVLLGIVLVGDAAILSAWTATFSESCGARDRFAFGSNIRITSVSCFSDCYGLIAASVAMKAILVLSCCYFSFRAQKTQDALADVGGVGMATYNLVVAGLLVVVVIWVDAPQAERTTAEAMAIVFAGIGALWSILVPKIIRAKHELEGKGLVGPSAIPSRGGSGDGGGGGRGMGLGSSSSEFLNAGGGGVPGDTTSGASLPSGMRNGGDRSRQVTHKASLFEEFTGVMGKSLAVISPDVRPDSDGSPPSSQQSARQVGGGSGMPGGATASSSSRQQQQQQHQQQRLPLQRRSNSAFSLPGSLSAKSAPGGGGGLGGGNFATTGGGGDKTLIVPDPSGFWTPPRRIRRSRSTTECRTRSADTMALAAAAAGAGGSATEGQKHFASGEQRAAKGGGDGGGGGGGGGGGERRSATVSRSGEKGQQGNNAGGGGVGSGGGGPGGAKPPLSGASGSSRASRASSRGRTTTRPRSNKASRAAKVVSSAGSGGADSNRSSRDSWALDPIILAINGHGWAMHGGPPKRKSGGGGGGGGGRGRRSSGRWSANGSVKSVKRAKSRERSPSVGSSSAHGRRSTGSLIMHAGSGTRLHCPHCDEEVAGCGFKGCSGSLVRAPSFSDDGFGVDVLPLPAAAPPPLLPPLIPSLISSETGIGGGSGILGGSGIMGGLGLMHTDGRLGGGGWGGSGGGGGGGAGGGGAGGPHASSQSASAATASAATAASHMFSPTHSTGVHKPHRLRMSFRRGPPPSDTFDNEADSSADEEDEAETSALGVSSPTSSSAWP